MIFRYFLINVPLTYMRMIQLYRHTITTLISLNTTCKLNLIMLKNGAIQNKMNKLFIHMKKTSSMLIGTRKKIKEFRPLCIQTSVENIESESKQKLLRFHIDENLTWHPHLDYLCLHIASKSTFIIADYICTNKCPKTFLPKLHSPIL